MNPNIAIQIEGLTKIYKIGKNKDVTLRGAMSRSFKKSNFTEEFLALKNINIEIEAGDVVGIIGRNGAGKSTLLKILSKITKPTSGRIKINGRIASLLEVGTGFHPELTGRENIFLNGTILGMSRKEVKERFDEIVTFSGIQKFIDTPVKHYSSGMYVRLAFAVAAHLDPEILIIDEVLAVGDAEFQKKCLGKMKEVAGAGRTVLFVSHHIGSVKQLCTKGILLEKGEITAQGSIQDVVSAYQTKHEKTINFVKTDSSNDYYVSKAHILGDITKKYSNEHIQFRIQITNKIAFIKEIFLLLRIVDSDDHIVGSSETRINEDKNNYTFTLKGNFLTKGEYKLNCIIYQPGIMQYDNVEECCHFEIIDNNSEFSHLETFDIGNVYLPNNWS